METRLIRFGEYLPLEQEQLICCDEILIPTKIKLKGGEGLYAICNICKTPALLFVPTARPVIRRPEYE